MKPKFCIVEWRKGGDVTCSLSEGKRRVPRCGIVAPIFQCEVDLSEDICESESAQLAYEQLIRDDIRMEARFARLMEECADGRGEVFA